jgi:hypothetical protein
VTEPNQPAGTKSAMLRRKKPVSTSLDLDDGNLRPNGEMPFMQSRILPLHFLSGKAEIAINFPRSSRSFALVPIAVPKSKNVESAVHCSSERE